MYFLDGLKVLARRWYIVVVGIVLVAAAGLVVLRVVPTQYQASGQMLILLPVAATGAETPTNPYLNAPAGLTTTASLLAGNATTHDAQESIAQAGYDAEYSVSVVPGAGPLLVVTSTGTSPADVIGARDEVMRRVDAELTSIQEAVSVPAEQLMFTNRSSVTRGADVLPGSKLRALIGVAGAGGVLTLLVAFALDRLLLARRQRRDRPAPTVRREPGAHSGATIFDADVHVRHEVPADRSEPVEPGTPAAEPVAQPPGAPVTQPVSQPVAQPVSQPAHGPVPEPAAARSSVVVRPAGRRGPWTPLRGGATRAVRS